MRLGPFETAALIAGSMGAVYGGRDRHLGRTAAKPTVAPPVGRKTCAAVARLRTLIEDPQAAPQAFTKGSSTMDTIASRINDKRLTGVLVNCPAIPGNPAKNALSASNHYI